MKILRMIIIASFVIFAILFIALEIAIKFKGKEIAIERLSLAFNRGVTVGKVKYVFPSGIYFEQLDIPSAMGATGAKFTIDFPASVSQRQLVFSEIILVDPTFFIEKRPDSRFTWGFFAASKFHGGPAGPGSGESAGARQNKKKADAEKIKSESEMTEKEKFLSIMEPFGKISRLGVSVNSTKVIKGLIHFVDSSSAVPKTAAIDFKDVHVKVASFSVPLKSVETRIDCAGVISSAEFLFDESWFELNGRVNFAAKDMDMQLKVIDPNGTVNLFSDVTSQNNDLFVKGKFSIKGSLNEEKLESFQASSFSDFLMVAVQKSGVDIDLDFSFRTKMDNFEIGKVNISGNLGMQGADIIKKPLK